MLKWKLKDGAEPQGSSDGFWYDISSGGYIRPAEVLADEEQIAQVKAAVELLASFETAMNEAGLINEF